MSSLGLAGGRTQGAQLGGSCIRLSLPFHLPPASEVAPAARSYLLLLLCRGRGASWQQVTAREGPAGSRGWEAAGGEMQSPSSAWLSHSIWSSHSRPSLCSWADQT